MKILLLVGYTYPVVGGTELASWNIANKLVENGNEVTVIARYSKGLRPDIIKSVGEIKRYEEHCDGRLKVYRARLLPTIGGRFLGQTLTAFKTCWLHPPDVILAFTLVPQCFSAIVMKYLLILTRLKNIPVIAWGRGSDVFVTPTRTDFIGQLTRLFLRIVFRSNLVLAQTPAMKEKLIEYGCEEGKIRIIGNGIDVQKYAKYPKVSAKNTVIAVGSARPAKGLPYLISAINGLPDVRLIIVGGWGEQHEICKTLANENTKFTGIVAPEEVPKYLSQASMFCMPSLSEGFPNSLLEAMAVGLPVVATNVGGIPHVLGDAGILVPSKDSNALREAIKTMLDEENLKKYSVKSLERVKLFSWENVIDELHSCFREVK